MEVLVAIGFLGLVMVLIVTWSCCETPNTKMWLLLVLTIGFILLGKATRSFILAKIGPLSSWITGNDLARTGSFMVAANYTFATLAAALLAAEALFRFVPLFKKARAR